MPIEVHCPSPTCARVHFVKNKYAGLRGKCPDCGAWMFVPADGQTPSSPAQQSAPVSAVAPTPPPAAPPRQPRWAGALLILVGLTSLAGLAATPFLDAGAIVAEGDFQADAAHPLEAIREESRVGVFAAPSVVAVLALLSLTAGLAGPRFGFFSLSLLHASALLAAGLLFVVVSAFHAEIHQQESYAQTVIQRQAAGAQGNAEYHLGVYLFAALLAAAGAVGSFTLAAVVLHRRWWSRVAAFLVLNGASVLAAVWVYRDQLSLS